MQNLRYIELYEDGELVRRVNVTFSANRITKKEQEITRKKLYEELLKVAKRNPEKVYWMELKTE